MAPRAQGGIRILQHSPIWTARWDVSVPSLLKLTFRPAARQVQRNSRMWCYTPCLGSRLTPPHSSLSGFQRCYKQADNHETGNGRWTDSAGEGQRGRKVLELVVSTFPAPLFIPGRLCEFVLHVFPVPCFQSPVPLTTRPMQRSCVAVGMGNRPDGGYTTGGISPPPALGRRYMAQLDTCMHPSISPPTLDPASNNYQLRTYLLNVT